MAVLRAHDVASKVLAIVFPISAFVALGFEHSVANMYLIPIGWLAGAGDITLGGLFANLLPATLGNVIGGVFVAAVCWLVYLHGDRLGSGAGQAGAGLVPDRVLLTLAPGGQDFEPIKNSLNREGSHLLSQTGFPRMPRRAFFSLGYR